MTAAETKLLNSFKKFFCLLRAFSQYCWNLNGKKLSITVWLTYILYFNILELYIELTKVFDKVAESLA